MNVVPHIFVRNSTDELRNIRNSTDDDRGIYDRNIWTFEPVLFFYCLNKWIYPYLKIYLFVIELQYRLKTNT